MTAWLVLALLHAGAPAVSHDARGERCPAVWPPSNAAAVPTARADMVWIPAGAFVMGRESPPRADEGPRHKVCLRGFHLGATLATVEQFAAYVAETGYRTTAERLGYGMVSREGMKDWEWTRTPGATWRTPFGSKAPAGCELLQDHPVTMVSFHDALAFCRHHNARLPTEAEWEYAMRAGVTDTRYPWGESPVRPAGGYGLNHWQGRSHEHAESADGHIYLSPVRAYPPNAWGLHDPVGNVWQLTMDRYAADTYARRAHRDGVMDPRGPGRGDNVVARGGSWWCSPSTCQGYGLFYRGKARPEAPFNNVGFRCAADAAAPPQQQGSAVPQNVGP
jgi:sulfatase modifying factor 1